MDFDRLQVVFKVVERCNINCDYCYYFNLGDETALSRPAVVSVDTSARIADWLAEGCADLGITSLSLAFHGGEPMMLKPRNFDAICTIFRDRLDPVVDLAINMQTNGTILSETWLDILERHRVHIGVSIDGDRVAHDRHRLDHRGRSTFAKTEANLKALRARAADDAAFLGPATISVLDAANDPAEVFGYLAELGLKRMSFLLPDRSHDTPFAGGDDTALAYGRALYGIFRAWLLHDDPGLYVRYIATFLSHFQLAKPHDDDVLFAKDAAPMRRTQVIIMHSNGKVGVNDSYIPALAWFEKTPEYSVESATLRDFLADPIFDEIAAAEASLPPACRRCDWQALCQGGDLENRFSSANGFANPSVYCEGLMYFLENATRLLVENGYPVDCLDLAIAS